MLRVGMLNAKHKVVLSMLQHASNMQHDDQPADQTDMQTFVGPHTHKMHALHRPASTMSLPSIRYHSRTSDPWEKGSLE